jgi:hypothetical protein
MKSTINSFHRMYSDLSSIGWAMVLGHAPAPVRALTPRPGQVVAVHQWEDEGDSPKPPEKPHAKPAIKRAPGNRPAPRIAPGRKRPASVKAKGARRK